MKIKDIINEGPGFISGFAKGLLPKAFKDVVSTPLRGEIPDEVSKVGTARANDVPDSDDDLAAKMFDPDGKQGWAAQNQLDRAIAQHDAEKKKKHDLAKRKEKLSAMGINQDPNVTQSNIITPDDTEFTSDESYNLSDENLAPSERIRVDTPAGTMYKYPDGRWYQVPSTGIPTPANPAHYSTLDDYANRDGSIEKIPTRPKTRKRR